MKKTEKSIAVLNKLIQVNNDRAEGYKTALKETKDEDLAVLFFACMETSKKCNTELIEEVNKLGGKPVEGTKLAFKFLKIWMNTKAFITENDRKTILNSCKYGEEITIDVYENILKNNLEEVSNSQQILLQSQYLSLKANYEQIKIVAAASK
jgi:uncharacterized protein (TIGR02284 family)